MDSTTRALNIPLILKRILKFLPSEDLLTARFVCAFWRDQAFWVFGEHDVPTIVAGPAIEVEDNQTSLNRFLAELKTVNGLPLTIKIYEWKQPAINFLQNYSTSIVRVALILTNLPEFRLNNRTFHLPYLMSSVLCIDTSGAYGNYENKMIKDAFKLWEEIMSGAEEPVVHCEMEVIARQRSAKKGLPVILQPPRQLKQLSLHMEDNTTSVYFNPAREFKKRKGDFKKNQLVFYNMNNLEQFGLTVWIEGHVNLNFGLCKNLKAIRAQGKCLIASADGTTSLARLLPTLEDLMILGAPTNDSISLTNLGNVPFECLETLRYTMVGCDHLTTMACARQIKFFPNLKELVVHWDTVDLATSALHFMASHLSHLEELQISVAKMKNDDDLVKMVTGVGQDEIPEDEKQWSRILDGKTNAICNLPNLECFFFINGGQLRTIKGFKFLMTALGRPQNIQDIRIANVKDSTFNDEINENGEFPVQLHGEEIKGLWRKL